MQHAGSNAFDASAYSGFRLLVRGSGDGYYLFLRTTKNLMPWSFYMAPINLSEQWQEILVPFPSFTKGDFGAFSELDLKRLASVAVVAYKKEFSARLELREIGLY
ncbi:MAG: CIA30 family protein [Spirochaetota bacterium]